MKELEKARVQLLLKYPFYAYLAMHLDDTEASWVPTAAVDGTHLFYNPDFIRALTPNETIGVVCHEVLHCALQHLTRKGIRETLKWNVATDLAINSLIRQDGIPLPKGVLYNKKFEKLAAEQIYNILPDPKVVEAVAGAGGNGEGGTLDDHSTWQAPSGDAEEGQGDGAGQQDGDKAHGAGQQPAQFDPIVWQERLTGAANAARMRGKLPGHLEQLVDEILHPKLDWRVVLRDFILSTVRNNYRLFPPNKRHLWRPIYLPSTYGEAIEIAVAIDTSGSITDDELKAFISEVVGITQQFADYTLHVIQCDAKVHRYEVVTPFGNDVLMRVKGRGGTDFRPPFALVADKGLPISALVYLTDGRGPFPDAAPQYPVLWLVTTDIQHPFGTLIEYSVKEGDR